MLQRDLVKAYLIANFERIEKLRKLNGFSWKPFVVEILTTHSDIGLDPENENHRDRLRCKFLNIRKKSRAVYDITYKDNPAGKTFDPTLTVLAELETLGREQFRQNIKILDEVGQLEKKDLKVIWKAPRVVGEKVDFKYMDTYNVKASILSEQDEFNAWKKEKDRVKNQKGMHVVVGCVHLPAVNKAFFNAFETFLHDAKDVLKGIHLIGDILDCKALSQHDNGQISEGTLEEEYRDANKFLDRIDKVLAPGIEKNYLWGNHEQRYERLLKKVDIAKFGGALLSPTKGCRFVERGYTVQEDYKNGKILLGNHLDLIHGEYISQNSTKKHLDVYKKSIMFAHCFSEDTEVLTEHGWCKFQDLTNERVATINLKTRQVEYQLPDSYHSYDHYKELVHFTSYGMDLMVTDEHAMVRLSGDNLVRTPAKDLLGKEFRLPNGGVNTLPDMAISDDELRLLGWMVTDGHYCTNRDKTKSYLRIKQCNKPKVGVAHITEILDNLGMKYSVSYTNSINYECGDIYVSTCDKINELIRLIPAKKLERWMLQLSKRQFDILLNEIILGDGTFYGNYSMQYVTGNQSDIDIMQSLCIHNGYRSSATLRNSSYWTMAISKRTTSTVRGEGSEVVSYEGSVYCVSVPNQTLIVRRNGKTSICGNTHKMGAYFDCDKAAFNIGWMGDKEHSAFGYCSRITKSQWQNGFAVVNIDEDGYYHVQLCQFYNGKFIFGTQEYKG